MKKKIKVGIAGQGRSGYHIHAAYFKQAADLFEITAVADEYAGLRKKAENEFGAKTYKNYKEMLEAGGFELFINATPSPFHVEASVQAMEAGYHVLCEKPMARTVKEFDAMAAVSERTGRILAPFQNNRFQPFFIEMQNIIRSGILGDIIHIRSTWGSFSRRWDWQTFQCNLGGCLFNTGPHAVDQALQFFPPDAPLKVESCLECRNELGGDADDYCWLALSAPKCPRVEILISQYMAYPQGDIYNISGTRGGLAGNSESLKWRYYSWADAPEQKIWSPWSVNQGYPSEKLPWKEDAWKIDEDLTKVSSGYTLRSYQYGVKIIYEALHKAICTGSTLAVTLPEVRRQIMVMEECHRQNPLPKKRTVWP